LLGWLSWVNGGGLENHWRGEKKITIAAGGLAEPERKSF